MNWLPRKSESVKSVNEKWKRKKKKKTVAALIAVALQAPLLLVRR
jgi:hypothetical protein